MLRPGQQGRKNPAAGVSCQPFFRDQAPLFTCGRSGGWLSPRSAPPSTQARQTCGVMRGGAEGLQAGGVGGGSMNASRRAGARREAPVGGCHEQAVLAERQEWRPPPACNLAPRAMRRAISTDPQVRFYQHWRAGCLRPLLAGREQSALPPAPGLMHPTQPRLMGRRRRLLDRPEQPLLPACKP